MEEVLEETEIEGEQEEAEVVLDAAAAGTEDLETVLGELEEEGGERASNDEENEDIFFQVLRSGMAQFEGRETRVARGAARDLQEEQHSSKETSNTNAKLLQSGSDWM